MASEMFCIADLSGRFLMVNQAWIHILGWQEADLVSQPFMNFVHPDDVEATIAEMGNPGNGGEGKPPGLGVNYLGVCESAVGTTPDGEPGAAAIIAVTSEVYPPPEWLTGFLTAAERRGIPVYFTLPFIAQGFGNALMALGGRGIITKPFRASQATQALACAFPGLDDYVTKPFFPQNLSAIRDRKSRGCSFHDPIIPVIHRHFRKAAQRLARGK